MRVLGKVAFVPVIASSVIAAGTGAAMAASAPPAAHVTGNGRALPFSAKIIISKANIYSAASNHPKIIGTAGLSDVMVCNGSTYSNKKNQPIYLCTDTTNQKRGWIAASAVSS